MGFCAICFAEGDDTVKLPGCGHDFHVACIVNNAQFDVRCPICRAVPLGVHRRADASDERDVRLFDVRAAHEAWRRAARRRRAQRQEQLRDNSALRELDAALRHVRAHIAREMRSTEATYQRRCRSVWRNDEQMRRHRRNLACMRARERRLIGDEQRLLRR
jgi:hypothetical protein